MTTSSPASTTPQLWVYCLCAQWCGTCREYQPLFDRLATEMPQARFVWVDVEEHDALLGDLDIENFPTLLLADAKHRPCFAGTVLPHGMAPGGPVIHQSITIDARGADAGVEARLRVLSAQIVRQASAATLDAIRRGGSATSIVRG